MGDDGRRRLYRLRSLALVWPLPLPLPVLMLLPLPVPLLCDTEPATMGAARTEGNASFCACACACACICWPVRARDMIPLLSGAALYAAAALALELAVVAAAVTSGSEANELVAALNCDRWRSMWSSPAAS